ncbi:MAG: hypothetical protein QG577_655 [Thermodesulfobacteriota bacterium]|nr:hypothetical protein [Thermodesulfobacteriota bacterium]
MKQAVKKLLLVLPLRQETDLPAVAEAEGWQDMNEFFKKTRTSYATHWHGNYVLDQDEIPWKASKEEIAALERVRGRVIVLAGWKYNISDTLTLYVDKDGSVYAVEDDVESFFE